MDYLFVFLSFMMALFLGRLIIPHILLVAFRKRLFDIPNNRKDHMGAIPRLGGVAFVPTLVFTIGFCLAVLYRLHYGISQEALQIVLPQLYMLLSGLILLFLVGLLDDLVGVRYRQKFVVQILAGSFFPLSGLWINNFYGLFGFYELSPWFGIPFTVFVVVFITNAINLIDGIDGLASGLCCVTCAVLGCLFFYKGVLLHALIAFTTLGVLIPFFYYNVFGVVERGRRIFMGDTGSLTLGLLLSFLIISFVRYEPVLMPYFRGSIIIAFSTLIIPLFDVIRVILIRFRQHKHPFLPDRNHIHHKFLDMDIRHHMAMMLIVLMACIFCILNVIGVQFLNNNTILFLDIVIWIGLNVWFDRIRDARLKKKDSVSLIIKDIK